MREIEIRGEMIRLGQLLQFAGVADSGGEARTVIEGGEVTVNGEPEERRGRQLRDGDRVEAGGETLYIRSTAPAPPHP